MDQALALEIMAEGHNVLLTGPAGSGKTYVLNEFIRRAKAGGKYVAVTATTGLAATHLGGNTIHAWSGMGIADQLHPQFDEHLLKGRRDIIEATDILVIDEISMLHDYRLDMVDEIARKVRKRDEPFGGIQVILCGDFFQLPPVNRGDSRQGSFVVSSEIWEEFDPVICYLEEQHRQDDDDFLEILNALRAGDVRRRHAELLLARVDADLGEHTEATELHTVNIDVDRINQSRLDSIPGKEHHYELSTSGKESYVESLKRSCLALDVLTLKKGALVMCIKNSAEKRYANGSLGTVVDFEKSTDFPIIELLSSGRRITMEPESWELRDGNKKRAAIAQIPLRLAWAITVHKSQGMTLDAARIDLRRAFVEGMGYVALSRVRRLDNLSLVGINRMALQISEEALEIDKQLRRKSASDAARFEPLREKALKRAALEKSNPTPKAATGGWTDKLAKMRAEYPNAYKPWTKADDAKLMDVFSDGKPKSLKDLTAVFGRHPGSIRVRLQKHFGEDAVADLH
ncbi:MAG TPA: PIF1 family DEAD/DEAH box helicase [Candidatus Saccharimonadales bacterium]|jgi:ATP-dependent exoDNAse (exonuclease V) alpha subunit